MDYFKVPLKGVMSGVTPAYQAYKPVLTGDPAIQLDDKTQTITIKIPAGLVKDHSGLKPLFQLLGINVQRDPLENIIAKYGTPVYQKEFTEGTLLEESRDALRNMVNQAPPNTGNIDFTDTPENVAAAILQAEPGLCLAREHGQESSLAVLQSAVDNGQIGMLFLEEFTEEEQATIDQYLTQGADQVQPNQDMPDLDLPPELKAKVNLLKGHGQGMNPQNIDWEPILKAARRKRVKIYAIDKGEARDNPPTSSELFAEDRDVKMNAFVKEVMDRALNDQANQGKKFMAVVGAVHANTHRGGIPGVSQMYGLAAVRMDDTTKKLRIEPEDQSLRGMPSRDEQFYIDRYIKEVESRDVPDPTRVGNKDLRTEATRAAATARNGGTLLTVEEQKFVDAYVTAAQEGPGAKADLAEIKYAAQKKAKQLTQGNQLPRGADVKALLPNKSTMTTELKAANQRYAKVKAIMDSKADVNQFTQLLAQDPTLIDVTDQNGRNLLHLASLEGNKNLIKAVLDTCPTANVNTPDALGNNALHLSCTVRKALQGDDMRNAAQKTAVDYLLIKGANIDAQTNAGSTALHLAAVTNNTKVLTTLLDNHADTTIRDSRGWTATDTAIGATSTDAENLFYQRNVANAATLGNQNQPRTTIDMLCDATLCEDPNDQAKVREAYEKLYDTPALRPVLELVALNSSVQRNPPNAGTRIFVAKGDNTGSMWKMPAGQEIVYPQGAYDETAGIVMVSAKSNNDFAGVLIHEMTHASTHIVNGTKPIPFADNDDNTKAAYIQAIEDDVKELHKILPTGQFEKDLHDRMMTRLGEYASRKGEDGLMEECIVGIPQLIATYGEAAVAKFVPNLTQFYKQTYTNMLQQAAQGNAFQNARQTIDDQPLANRPPYDYTEAGKPALEESVSNTAVQVKQIVKAVEAEFMIQHGDTATVKGLVGVAYNTDAYKLDDPQKLNLKKKLDHLEKALTKALDPKLMTLPVTRDGLQQLITDTCTLIDQTPEKDVEKVMTEKANKWLIQDKFAYLRQKTDLLTDVELAESIVLSAEYTAKGDEDYTVNTDKHSKLIADLTKGIGKLSGDKKDDSVKQHNIMDTLINQIQQGGPKSQGVYQKTGKKADPEHVSLEVKKLKNDWLTKLGNL